MITPKSLQQNDLLVAALDYAARGWRVLPVHGTTNGLCTCNNSGCKSKGKHPRTRQGVRDATTDTAMISRWWADWPSANIGIATGPQSGIFMIGPDGQAG